VFDWPSPPYILFYCRNSPFGIKSRLHAERLKNTFPIHGWDRTFLFPTSPDRLCSPPRLQPTCNATPPLLVDLHSLVLNWLRKSFTFFKISGESQAAALHYLIHKVRWVPLDGRGLPSHQIYVNRKSNLPVSTLSPLFCFYIKKISVCCLWKVYLLKRHFKVDFFDAEYRWKVNPSMKILLSFCKPWGSVE
jgi:hypothetical protein